MVCVVLCEACVRILHKLCLTLAILALREVVICSGCLFELPVMLRRQAFLLLFQPSHQHFAVKVVAFQAAVAIINTMTPADASLMMCFAVGPESNAKVPNDKRIQPLLVDLLRRRGQLNIHARLLLATSDRKGYRPLQVHNTLAREALSLETFPVDLDNLGRPILSAWKIGNSILTLRLGSRQYFGWVEIVLRSPCSRIRRLVQWKKELLRDSVRPESTIPFWEQLHPRSRMSEEKLGAMQNNRLNLESGTRLNSFARATSVIACFDSLVDGNSASVTSRLEVDGVKMYPVVKSDNSNPSRHPKPQSRVAGCLKRTLSDGHLSSLSLSYHENSRDRSRSVFSWLQRATCRDDVDVELIEELETIGISPLALGIPTTVMEPACCSELSMHEKLLPYNVGPNFMRAISILDRITPFQTHRVGLLYGGPFSNANYDSPNNGGDEAFLTSTQAPMDFWDFAKALGDLVPVRHCKYFSGGL